MNRILTLRAMNTMAALGLALISVYLLGEIHGIKEGYDAVIRSEFPDIAKIQFSADGPNFYAVVCRAYAAIFIASGIYLIARLFSMTLAEGIANIAIGWIQFVFSCVLVSIIAYTIIPLLAYKNEILGSDSSHFLPYRAWLQCSIRFDRFCGFLLIILILGEILHLFFLNRRRNV